MASAEIHSYRTSSGTMPPIKRPLEGATQTFKAGVPVTVSQAGPNQGYLVEWDGVTISAAIAGFSQAAGNNLTTKGTAQQLTFGSVPNQSSAVKIPVGAPANDGKLGIETADPSTVFFGQCGPAQLVAQTDIGVKYGMTKDADGHWYVDRNKTGVSAILVILDIDANVNPIGADPRGFYFSILPASQQQIA